MDYENIGSVCDLMAICEQTLTEDQMALVLRGALQGLEYLHANHVTHRDVKAGNILLKNPAAVTLSMGGSHVYNGDLGCA